VNTLRSACLEQLKTAIPGALSYALSRDESLCLADYAAMLPGGFAALQDGQDLLDLATAEASRLFTPAVGAALRRQWEERFLALTANHLGVDHHPEFLQGNLLLALDCSHAVPLLACGGVTCNNMAWPRGLLLPPRSADSTLPHRLPILPVGDRHAFVSAQIPFGPEHLRNALNKLEREKITERERSVAASVLNCVYTHPNVLIQKSFRDQMAVANALLWQHLAAPDLRLPPLVCLDLQHLCARLVAKDLQSPNSLAYRLLLEPVLTEAIWHQLNGVRACWTIDTTGQLLRGSFLFWALDEKGRGLALRMEERSPSDRTLVAVQRPETRFALEARSLQDALNQGLLLPTLYLSFAVTAMARGLACAGGVFQYDYLPLMAEHTISALRQCHEHAIADRIGIVSPLGTGFHALHARAWHADSPLHAAGALDILHNGGLTAKTWENIAQAKVYAAFEASLPFQYEDIIPQAERLPGWLDALRRPAPCLL